MTSRQGNVRFCYGQGSSREGRGLRLLIRAALPGDAAVIGHADLGGKRDDDRRGVSRGHGLNVSNRDHSPGAPTPEPPADRGGWASRGRPKVEANEPLPGYGKIMPGSATPGEAQALPVPGTANHGRTQERGAGGHRRASRTSAECLAPGRRSPIPPRQISRLPRHAAIMRSLCQLPPGVAGRGRTRKAIWPEAPGQRGTTFRMSRGLDVNKPRAGGGPPFRWPGPGMLSGRARGRH
jgi:hypothetical protein